MTTELIAQLATLPVATIRALRKTSTTSAPQRVVDAVLSITFHPSRGRDLTPAVGAHRRLRALNAMGYGDDLLAARLGVDINVVTGMPTKSLIPSGLWKAIDSIYDELSMRPGPDAEIREQSRAAGVVPPLGWDDDEIDNPKARSQERVQPRQGAGAVPVDEAVVIRRLGGEQMPLRFCERREIVRIAFEKGWSPTELATRLSIKYDSAVTELSRYRRALARDAAADSDSSPEVSNPQETTAEVLAVREESDELPPVEANSGRELEPILLDEESPEEATSSARAAAVLDVRNGRVSLPHSLSGHEDGATPNRAACHLPRTLSKRSPGVGPGGRIIRHQPRRDRLHPNLTGRLLGPDQHFNDAMQCRPSQPLSPAHASRRRGRFFSGARTSAFVYSHAGGLPQRKANEGKQPQGYVRPIDIADSG
ncbi:hypothetical protein [Rhodococcus sp. 1139]|uniref:hypothetical protein n=1 Tax=unclassified Rhodococcus (in: high G+C Gram-positive bacteria) TaxID=192944 RepID=UPI001F0F6E50|nr:hypothetical protein [Rhodococcus sp. 1139]